jgi:hypothetical protein
MYSIDQHRGIRKYFRTSFCSDNAFDWNNERQYPKDRGHSSSSSDIYCLCGISRGVCRRAKPSDYSAGLSRRYTDYVPFAPHTSSIVYSDHGPPTHQRGPHLFEQLHACPSSTHAKQSLMADARRESHLLSPIFREGKQVNGRRWLEANVNFLVLYSRIFEPERTRRADFACIYVAFSRTRRRAR